MPDIMMCAAANCYRSATCYRHADSGTKPDEYRQSYWLRDSASPNGAACENYWQAAPLVAAMHNGSMS